MLPSEYLAQGWCQNRVEDDDGNVCWVGAVSKAGMWNYDFHTPASRILQLEKPSDVITWNNTPDRTQAEVVALARLVEMKLGLRPVEDIGEVEEPALVDAGA